jgi:hypothetical protein
MYAEFMANQPRAAAKPVANPPGGLALAERQRPEVLPVELQQIEGPEDGLAHLAMAVQGIEHRDAVGATHNGLTIQRERLRPQLPRGAGYRGIAVGPIKRTAAPSRRTISRYPSYLISCTQPGPAGGFEARVGMQGSTNPSVRSRRTSMPTVVVASDGVVEPRTR